MMAWLEQHLADILLWVTLLSIATVVVALVAIPWIVTRLPADYFSATSREPLQRRYGIAGPLLSLLKNLVGLTLVIVGVLLILTPGQGLLTILLGLLLMNFPGKYRLERAVARKPSVLRGLNWLRARGGQPPFEAPGRES